MLYLVQINRVVQGKPLFVIEVSGGLAFALLGLWVGGYCLVMLWKCAEHLAFRRRIPVSYTHLDVYKRQDWGYSGGQQQYQERNEYRAAENYIRARHFQEAMTVLSSVSSAERDARWYFLAGIANSGLGNKITAMEFAQRAVQLEPDNEEYRRFLDELQHGLSLIHI